MAAEDDIDPKNEDKRHQQPGRCLQYHIVFWLVGPVMGLRLFLAVFAFLTVCPQKNQHRTGGDKKYMRFSQRVKGPIVQDHTRDKIHRPRLLQSLLNIPPGHFVIHRSVRLPQRGQIRHPHKEHGHQQDAEQQAESPIHFLKQDHLPVVFRVIDPGAHPLSVFLHPPQGSFIFLAGLPGPYLQIAQIGIPAALQPDFQPIGKGFLVPLTRQLSTHKLRLLLCSNSLSASLPAASAPIMA